MAVKFPEGEHRLLISSKYSRNLIHGCMLNMLSIPKMLNVLAVNFSGFKGAGTPEVITPPLTPTLN